MPLSTRATPFTSVASGGDIGLCDLNPGVFVLTNPTLGTAISGHAAATTFDETKALLYLYNGGSNYVYLRRGLLKLSNAGSAGTTIRFTQCLDTGPRTPSSGSAATNILSKGNTSFGPGSSVTAYFGAVVIPAASSARQIVGDFQYRDVIGVVRDTYGFLWGAHSADLFQTPQAATNGTAESDLSISYDPVRIGPGQVFTIHQWSASQSAAYQFEPVAFSYVEVLP
jgi:hypothetical protein